jgi:hypothetical protein
MDEKEIVEQYLQAKKQYEETEIKNLQPKTRLKNKTDKKRRKEEDEYDEKMDIENAKDDNNNDISHKNPLYWSANDVCNYLSENNLEKSLIKLIKDNVSH